jgi:hypothetical protein
MNNLLNISSNNRVYLWSAAIVSVLLLAIFKLFYPYPNMVMDSYVYIKAACLDLGANSFPIGYSRFLQLFHFFTHSATALVCFQYLFLEVACICFFFTVLYFFQPQKWVRILIFLFIFANPLLLYMANFVMADTLFTTLSLFWLTQLIWIIWHPKAYMILTHAVLISLAFTIRYNALYYPFFGTLVLLICRLKPWLKVAAIGLQFLLIGSFILYTCGQMKILTGVSQFSPFGGWKLANCALYMYGHVYKEDHNPVPAKFRQLDSVVRDYFTGVNRVDVLLDYRSYNHGNYYAFGLGSPLIRYMYWRYGYDTIFQNFKKWGPAGSLYGEYGFWLVRNHPISYFRYYTGPNLFRYGMPPSEIFEYLTPYYLRSDDFGQLAVEWFNLRTLKVPDGYIRFRTALLSNCPIIIVAIHVIFVLYLFSFLLSRARRSLSWEYKTTISCIGILWLTDCLFNATASGIVMRYLIFTVIMEFSFALVLLDFLYRKTELRQGTLAKLRETLAIDERF